MAFLVLLPEDPARAEAARARCGRVVQAASPRLLLCDGDPSGLAGTGATRLATPADVAAAGLDAGERLFAEAWLGRGTPDGKDRPGDGLNWDTPPFEAP